MIKKLHNWSEAHLPALILLALLTLLPGRLWAADGDTFEYTYEGQTLEYTIISEAEKTVKTKEGVKYNTTPGNYVEGELILPSVVSHNGNDYTLTEIGQMAFYNRSSLTSVTIPNSVTSIGKKAFYRCDLLKDFTVADGETTINFDEDALDQTPIDNLYLGRNWTYAKYAAVSTGIKSVTLSDNVTLLPFYAFSKCSELTSINIPNSVTSIGESAFYECSGLTSVTIPNSVTSIGKKAFSSCSALTSVEIPNSVTYIGESAFYECSGLKSIEIPNSVTTIGESAFSGCSSLTSVTIPNSVTSIDSYAFARCSSLTSVTIPNSVTSIGNSAFAHCSSLKSIEIPNSVTSIGNSTFYNCSRLTSVTIPNSVTSIGFYAFSGCSSLTSVTIPNSVTSISSYAFSGCSGLIKSAYPSNLRNPFSNGITICYPAENSFIEDGLVWGADKSVIYFAPLTIDGEYTIPASVTEIGSNAFAKCTLTSITSEALVAPVISEDSFEGLYETCSLNVPNEGFDSYILGNWILFKTINGGSLVDNGNFKYFPNKTGNTAVLMGPAKEMTEATILAKVNLDGKMYDVKAIASNAFKNQNLTKVTFRSGIETIGDYAFYGNYLTKLELPASTKTIGDYGFASNSALASATLGSGVETIGDYAFQKTGLTEISIPDAVKTIGGYAFASNSALKSVTLGSGVETIGDHVFYWTGLTDVTIPDAVKTIGGYAFATISALKSVTLGSSVETIGDHAFFETGLTEVTIPDAVKTIGGYAFATISALKSVTLGSSVETIGDHAFFETGLTEVTIPDAVKTIGDYAFFSTGLTGIEIPASVNSIGNSAFGNCSSLNDFKIADGTAQLEISNNVVSGSPIKNLYIGRNYSGDIANIISTDMTSLVLGNCVTEIPESAFASSSKLASVTLGSGLTEIPANAFKGCALTEVVVPSNITTIGESAFENNSLTNVIIGCGTAQIDKNAFANNNRIATINVTAVEPPVATDDVFTTQNAQLNVLKDSREAYENAVCWYQFEGTDLVPISVFKILNEPVPANAHARAAGENPAGKQIQFSATVEPANASLKDYIFWESSDPEVATVDGNGLVTLGAKQGEAKITARTLYDGVLASATVTSDGNVQGGIDDIYIDNTEVNRPNDVYNLQGMCIKRNASQDDIKTLTPGLYIIAGKKVLVK